MPWCSLTSFTASTLRCLHHSILCYSHASMMWRTSNAGWQREGLQQPKPDMFMFIQAGKVNKVQKSSSYNYSDMVWYCSLAWVAVVLKTLNGALHASGIVLMNIETRLLLFLLPSCGFFDLQKRWRLGLMHAMGLPVATSCILFILLAHCNHSNITVIVSALEFITCTPQPNII